MITYPCYGLSNSIIQTTEDDKIVYAEWNSGIINILDNKNLEGNTLGQRRLRITPSKLCKIKKTFFSFKAMKDSRLKRFISNKGDVFVYNKTYSAKLKYYKIIRTDRVDSIGLLLYTKELPYPIKISNSIWQGEDYVGTLHVGKGTLLYELSTHKKKDTWRKV